jgi:hypothetical protein
MEQEEIIFSWFQGEWFGHRHSTRASGEGRDLRSVV